MTEPTYLTLTEAAAVLRLCTRSLARLALAGKIAAKRRGERGRLLFSPEALEAYLKDAEGRPALPSGRDMSARAERARERLRAKGVAV